MRFLGSRRNLDIRRRIKGAGWLPYLLLYIRAGLETVDCRSVVVDNFEILDVDLDIFGFVMIIKVINVFFSRYIA